MVQFDWLALVRSEEISVPRSKNQRFWSLIDCSGNFSSKSGCIDICSEKNLYSRLPNVDEIFALRERYADYKLFLKPHSILKPTPIETNFGNKSTFVKLKNLDKDIRFIIDGYYDFENKIWMDNKRIIRNDDWFQSKLYYLNYPVMNDRIAFKKGKMIQRGMRLLDGHFVQLHIGQYSHQIYTV